MEENLQKVNWADNASLYFQMTMLTHIEENEKNDITDKLTDREV